MSQVSGTYDPAFAQVHEVFAASFAEGLEDGAAVSVVCEGRVVVELWGGVADPATERPWQAETPALVFSTTKGLLALAVLARIEAGGLDLDAPVARYWPEFGAADKDAVTVRDVLAHRAGLPALGRTVSVDKAADPAAMAALLAAQEPAWEPGTAHGYHALTWGWLVAEVVRQATGDDAATLFAGLAGRAGAAVAFPPDRATYAQAARIRVPEPRVDGGGKGTAAGVRRDPSHERPKAALAAALRDPGSLSFRALRNPPLLVPQTTADAAEVAVRCWPSTGAVVDATSLARIYASVAAGQVVSAGMLAEARRPISDGPDKVLLRPSRFGLGLMTPGPLLGADWPGGFGHSGAGGSLGFGDVDHEIGFGYVTARMGQSLTADSRAVALLAAVGRALGQP